MRNKLDKNGVKKLVVFIVEILLYIGMLYVLREQGVTFYVDNYSILPIFIRGIGLVSLKWDIAFIIIGLISLFLKPLCQYTNTLLTVSTVVLIVGSLCILNF